MERNKSARQPLDKAAALLLQAVFGIAFADEGLPYKSVS
jgi:hypothetical protein